MQKLHKAEYKSSKPCKNLKKTGYKHMQDMQKIQKKPKKLVKHVETLKSIIQYNYN